MTMTFRWYGPSDPVTLNYIRQIPGVTGIVSHMHHQANYIVWSLEDLRAYKNTIEESGLTLDVFEANYVHEDVKRGYPTRDKYIDIMCENITNLGKIGVPVMCYNLMPVFDWVRTEMRMPSPLGDGSESLAYIHHNLTKLGVSLPGWDNRYTPDEFKALVDSYKNITPEMLWDNFFYLLRRIVPVAEKAGVKLAIHPTDPPHPVMGIHRTIIGTTEAVERMITTIPSKANGITFCTGSYGVMPTNDLVKMVHKAKGHIHFCHLRNIKRTAVHYAPNGEIDGVDYYESPHRDGDVDMYAVMEALVDIGFDGPIRPDHGRDIWGDVGTNKRPGYGLYDRALGTQYLLGLQEAIMRAKGLSTKTLTQPRIQTPYNKARFASQNATAAAA